MFIPQLKYAFIFSECRVWSSPSCLRRDLICLINLDFVFVKLNFTGRVSDNHSLSFITWATGSFSWYLTPHCCFHLSSIFGALLFSWWVSYCLNFLLGIEDGCRYFAQSPWDDWTHTYLAGARMRQYSYAWNGGVKLYLWRKSYLIFENHFLLEAIKWCQTGSCPKLKIVSTSRISLSFLIKAGIFPIRFDFFPIKYYKNFVEAFW